MDDRIHWARPALLSGLIGGPLSIVCCCVPAIVACFCFPVEFVLPGLIAGVWTARSAANAGRCPGADVGAMAGLVAGLVAGVFFAIFDGVVVLLGFSALGQWLQEEAVRGGSEFLQGMAEAQRSASPFMAVLKEVVINFAGAAFWSTLGGIGGLLLARRSSFPDGGGAAAPTSGSRPLTGSAAHSMRDVTPATPPVASPPPDLPEGQADAPPPDSPPALNADEDPPGHDPEGRR